MKKIFLTFADSRMRPTARRIRQQARDLDIYDRIVIADESDLEKSFRKHFQSKLIFASRGYGYWAWKPQIILQTLRRMEEGDILQYTDAGCHLNPKGKWRLCEYFKITELADTGILAFQATPPQLPLNYDGRELLNLRDYMWTKGDVLDYFHVRNKNNIIHTETIGAGVFFIKKNQFSLCFVNNWLSVIYDNFSLIDDTPSESPNIPGFIEHRHDQAIFSIMCKIYNIETLSAYEYWYPSIGDIWNPDWAVLANFPIHAKRDKVIGIQHRLTRRMLSLLRRIRNGLPN